VLSPQPPDSSISDPFPLSDDGPGCTASDLSDLAEWRQNVAKVAFREEIKCSGITASNFRYVPLSKVGQCWIY
jgi:hypothetical protein